MVVRQKIDSIGCVSIIKLLLDELTRPAEEFFEYDDDCRKKAETREHIRGHTLERAYHRDQHPQHLEGEGLGGNA